MGISLALETPLFRSPRPTTQGEVNTHKRFKSKYLHLPSSSSLWKVIWRRQAGVRAKKSLPSDSTQNSPARGVSAVTYIEERSWRLDRGRLPDPWGIWAPSFPQLRPSTLQGHLPKAGGPEGPKGSRAEWSQHWHRNQPGFGVPTPPHLWHLLALLDHGSLNEEPTVGSRPSSSKLRKDAPRGLQGTEVCRSRGWLTSPSLTWSRTLAHGSPGRVGRAHAGAGGSEQRGRNSPAPRRRGKALSKGEALQKLPKTFFLGFRFHSPPPTPLSSAPARSPQLLPAPGPACCASNLGLP